MTDLELRIALAALERRMDSVEAFVQTRMAAMTARLELALGPERSAKPRSHRPSKSTATPGPHLVKPDPDEGAPR